MNKNLTMKLKRTELRQLRLRNRVDQSRNPGDFRDDHISFYGSSEHPPDHIVLRSIGALCARYSEV
jgi:hypothetical protein